MTGTPAGINCVVQCTAAYDFAASVVLTASPDAGSTFGGWSGACTAPTGTCTVTMDQARTVTATFAIAQDPNESVATNVSVFRPGTGVWYLQSPFSAVAWGEPDDLPVPGDYDGDGTIEHAVYRPETGALVPAGSNPPHHPVG